MRGRWFRRRRWGTGSSDYDVQMTVHLTLSSADVGIAVFGAGAGDANAVDGDRVQGTLLCVPHAERVE